MKKTQQLTLAYSLLAVTFVVLCVNSVIFESTRSPLSIAGIVISALATFVSAVLTVLTYRKS